MMFLTQRLGDGTSKMLTEPWSESLVLLVVGLGVFWVLLWQVFEIFNWSQSAMDYKVLLAYWVYHEIIGGLALRGVM